MIFFTSIFVDAQSNKIKGKDLEAFSYDYISVNELITMKEVLSESYLLSKIWMKQKRPRTPEKIKLQKYNAKTIPELLRIVSILSTNWTPTQRDILTKITLDINKVLVIQDSMMNALNTWNSYEDVRVFIQVMAIADFGNDLDKRTRDAINNLEVLIEYFQSKIKRHLPPLQIDTIKPMDLKKRVAKEYFKLSGLKKQLRHRYLVEFGEKLTSKQIKSFIELIYNYYTETELRKLIILLSNLETKSLIEKERVLDDKLYKLLIE